MESGRSLVNLLRNVRARELEAALLRDGFVLRRQTRTGGRLYSHPHGRITNVHPHRGSDVFKRGTLASILDATRWTEDDARRLGLR